jgi:hypothetical protein
MTKKILYFFIVIVIAVACKDDEPAPTFAKADFIGSWEMTSTTAEPDPDCPDATETLEIGETTMTITSACSGSGSISIDLDYTFNGKNTLSYEIFGIDGKMQIIELSATTMKMKQSAMGESETVTYTKI